MKKLITLLLVLTQTTWAAPGLPPTSLQGQSDAAPKTKFFFQVPNSQSTDLGGVRGLIETGNGNILANPSFEDNGPSGYSHFWTITKTSGTTFTGAVDTSNYEAGKQSAQLTLTSAIGCITQDVTPNQAGGNHENSIWVKTSLTDVQVCSRTGGTTSTSNCQTLTGTNTWVPVVLNQPGPSGSEGISVCNQNSESGTFNVDDAYVGVARNVQSGAQQMTNWAAATFTSLAWQGLGTVTNNLQVRRIGDSMQIRGKFTTGTTTASQAQIPLPSNFGTVTSSAAIQTNEIGGSILRNVAATGSFSAAILQPSVSYINISAAPISAANNPATPAGGSTFANSSEVEDLQVTVPITQFGALSLLNTVDQSDFGWTSCDTLTIGAVTTPPTKGMPSVDQCRYKRVGDKMEYQYTYIQTAGGTAGSGQYLFPIPNSLAADTTKITADTTSGTIIGHGGASNATNFVSADSAILQCYLYDSTHVACREQNVADQFQLFGSGSSVTMTATNMRFSFSVSVPISTWANTNRAPNLIGSVTSSASNTSYHVDYVKFGGASEGSNCTGTCTPFRNSPGVSSVTRTGSGAYTINFPAGEFSAPPTCTTNSVVWGTGSGSCYNSATPTAIAFAISCAPNNSEVPADSEVTVQCQGPR